MDIRGKKLLVIGGAGLIGSHTVDLLLKEDVGEIVVFDNLTRGGADNLQQALADPRVRIFNPLGDIRDTDVLARAMEGVDGVFHFAALWLLHCHEYPRAAMEVNIQGTFNVMEACVAAGVKRLVFSSSASVYGDAVRPVMDEDHPFNNTTFYGASKIAGEAMLHAHHHRYGLPYVGLRYFNVYGARQDYRGTYIAVIMKMLDRMDQGLPPIIMGDGSQAYDFIYVGDCALANVTAMKADVVDKVYNVCTGVQSSLLTLANMLIDLTGSDLKPEFQDARPGFVTNRVGSPDLAAAELGFRSTVDLRDGLRMLIDWRREQTGQVDRKRANAGAA